MPVDLHQLDHRLGAVERDVADLRDALTEERIATSRLAAQVDAHEVRGQERHAEVLASVKSLRDDVRQLGTQAAAREGRLGKIALSILGVLGSAVAYLGAQ
jgi:phage terminase small subunit